MENPGIKVEREHGTRVVPLPRRTLAPGAALARERLLASGSAARARAAIGILFAVWGRGREAGGWVRPETGSLAEDTGLRVSEVAVGLEAAIEAGVLESKPSGEVRVDTDLLCDLPHVADLCPAVVRDRLRARGGVASSLAVLYELARRAPAGERVAVSLGIDALAAECLYSRGAVKVALASLEAEGLIERSAAPGGVAIRLRGVLFGASEEPPAGSLPAVVTTPAAVPRKIVARLKFNGSSVEIASGLDYRVEPGEDGLPEITIL